MKQGKGARQAGKNETLASFLRQGGDPRKSAKKAGHPREEVKVGHEKEDKNRRKPQMSKKSWKPLRRQEKRKINGNGRGDQKMWGGLKK